MAASRELPGTANLVMAESPQRYLLKNAGVVSVWRAAGVASGLLLDGIILAGFGFGIETDAFFAALTLPFIIASIFETQGPNILVPIFTTVFASEDARPSWDFVSNLLNTSSICLLLVCLGATLAAGFLIPLQVPGLPEESLQLAVGLIKILIWIILFRGQGAILKSLLYTRHRYGVASASQCVANISACTVVFFLAGPMGIRAVALGFSVGALMSVLVMILALSRDGFRPRMILDFRDPSLQRVHRLMVLPFAGHIVNSSRSIIENFLASFLGSGAVALIRYANRIIQTMAAVLVGGVIKPTLALLSKHVNQGEVDRMKEDLFNGLKLIAFVALPLAAWIFFVGQTLLVLLFQRGEFSLADAALTAQLLILMLPFMFFSRVNSIVQTPFYASLDMQTPVVVSVLSLLSYLSFVLLFKDSLGVYSFGLATSLASVLSAIVMWLMLRRRFGPMQWWRVKRFGLRLAAATGVCAIAMAFAAPAAGYLDLGHVLANRIVAVLVPTLAGSASFLAAALSLRIIRFTKRIPSLA